MLSPSCFFFPDTWCTHTLSWCITALKVTDAKGQGSKENKREIIVWLESQHGETNVRVLFMQLAGGHRWESEIIYYIQQHA